ncbi:MAG: tetratricopeptide repeat protein [candidate division Zixibacteria bacterium]|nr:tetratricopeptide repeat protein [candidate division Zixibacteria bacterium]
MKFSTARKGLGVWFLFILLFSMLMLLLGCGTKNPGLTSAKIYLNLTPPDYEKAMQQLQIALKQEPQNAEAHFLLGKIYAEKKMYKEMLEEFQKAEASELKPKLKLKPKQLEELQQIRKQKWTEVLNSGIRLGRKRKQVEQYKLELLTDFSNYTGYKDSLKTISADLEGSERFTWDAYQMFGQVKPALEDLERTLEQEAIDRYQLAILFDSTRYEPFLNLAAEYVRNDELKKALGYYQKAYQLKPDDSNVMNDYAITLLGAKKFEQALSLYERILEKDPTNVNALVNVAMIYARKGETEKALSTYSRIISIDPEYKDAYFNRGLLLLTKVQDKILVLKSYKDSVQKNSKDQKLLSRYQSAQEDYSRLFVKAEGDFKKTTELDPGDKDSFFHLGLLYLGRAQTLDAGEKQNDNFSQAEGFFKKTLELDPQDRESMKYLGFSLLSLKKWAEASLHLERLVESDPTDREAWGYLAIAYARLGKKDKAEEALKKSAR